MVCFVGNCAGRPLDVATGPSPPSAMLAPSPLVLIGCPQCSRPPSSGMAPSPLPSASPRPPRMRPPYQGHFGRPPPQGGAPSRVCLSFLCPSRPLPSPPIPHRAPNSAAHHTPPPRALGRAPWLRPDGASHDWGPPARPFLSLLDCTAAGPAAHSFPPPPLRTASFGRHLAATSCHAWTCSW